MSSPRIEFQATMLEDVLRWYAKDFKTKATGEKLSVLDSYVDTSKGVVIFKLLVTPPQAKEEKPNGRE